MNVAYPAPSGPLNTGSLPAAATRRNSPHPLATAILLVYLFLLMSRGVEILPLLVGGVNLHITMILVLVSMLAAFLTGGLVKAVQTPVGMLFIALTGWLCLATLTSQWKGGSARTMAGFWISSLACALLLPSLVSTLEQCRKVCYVLAFCLLPVLASTVIFHTQIQGRDSSRLGTFENPNDLAFSMLLLAPFAVLVMQSESWLNWKKLVCVSALAYALYKTLRTGSRAGVLTLAACFLIVMIYGQAKTKIKTLAAVSLLAVLVLPLMPTSTLRRYLTMFDGTSYEATMSEDEVSAVASTRSRKMLLQESIRVLAEYPLLGVGPGIFSAALAGEQEKKGEVQTWHEAHNSFTQLGSEAGIPALALYLALVIYCLKRAVSIYRRTRSDPNRILITRTAGCLAVALVIYVVCAAFGNYTYTFHFPVIAGLIQAFDICVRKEMTVAIPVAPPSVPMFMATPAPQPRVSNYVRNRRYLNSRV